MTYSFEVPTPAFADLLLPRLSFEDAWAAKEREGFQYGPEAVDNVRFGWELREACEREARARLATLLGETSRGPEESIVAAARRLVGTNHYIGEGPRAWVNPAALRRLRSAFEFDSPESSRLDSPRWTVSAYLVRERRVLLVRHKRLGMWLPVGGGIEAGERPAEAVLREVREETGFTVDGIECLGFDEHLAGGKLHLNLAHRANVLPAGEPVSDGSWDEHLWLRIGREPPQGTPNNVHKVLRMLAEGP